PIVIPDNGSPAGWICLFSNASSQANGFNSERFEREVAGRAPEDTSLITPTTSSASWPSDTPSTLYPYLQNDLTVYGGNGTEYLSLGSEVHWLAGFTAFGPAQGIEIARLIWTGPTGREFTLASSPVASVDMSGAPTENVRLQMIESRPREGRVSWRVWVPFEM